MPNGGPRWVELVGDELDDYLNGEINPVRARFRNNTVEVYMPHHFSGSGIWTGQRVCLSCGLLPLDYDAIEYECEEG